MSVWAATQKLVYQLLVADAGVHAYVGDRIYDGVPSEPVWPYISFGPSDVSDIVSPTCFDERSETLQVDIWTSDQSRLRIAKEIADAVKGALHKGTGTLESGALVQMLVTRMQVMPDADGIGAHGIVQLTVHTEDQGGA